MGQLPNYKELFPAGNKHDNGRKNKAMVLGISGCTNSGKSTLAKQLLDELERCGSRAVLIKQDAFYKLKEEVRILWNKDDPTIKFYDYDTPRSINELEMVEAIKLAISDKRGHDFVIVDGNMLTDLERVFGLLDHTIFITIGKELCRERRNIRKYDPPDEIGYFDQIVWPFYEKTLEKAQKLFPNQIGQFKQNKLAFLDGNLIPKLDDLISMFKHLTSDKLLLQNGLLDLEKAVEFIGSPECGAESIFVGTTRNTFEGKAVVHLEYEAYTDMAYNKLQEICLKAHKLYPIYRITIFHRIGVVDVGQASVIVATSSPQRKAAISATEWLIDELKSKVPIWKKEVYADGSCSWKENKECDHKSTTIS